MDQDNSKDIPKPFSLPADKAMQELTNWNLEQKQLRAKYLKEFKGKDNA